MKEIREKIEEADSKLKEYIKIAEQLGKMICEKYEKEKGWKCEYQLGDYEAGVDHIYIIVNSGAHCFSEIVNEEIDLYKETDDKHISVGFRPNRTEILHKDCKKHKR